VGSIARTQLQALALFTSCKHHWSARTQKKTYHIENIKLHISLFLSKTVNRFRMAHPDNDASEGPLAIVPEIGVQHEHKHEWPFAFERMHQCVHLTRLCNLTV
jgi:hypothetical protein